MTVPNAIGECEEYQGAMVAYETMAGFSQVGEIILAEDHSAVVVVAGTEGK